VSRNATGGPQPEGLPQRAQQDDNEDQRFSGLAHDILNLLAVMRGHVQLILTELDSGRAEISGNLEGFVAVGARASALVDQLLLSSGAEVCDVLNVAAAIRSMEPVLQRLIGQEIELVAEVDPELWGVAISRSHFEQLLVSRLPSASGAMSESKRVLIRAETDSSPVIGGEEQGVLISIHGGKGTAESESTASPKSGSSILCQLRVPRVNATVGLLGDDPAFISAEKPQGFEVPGPVGLLGGGERILLSEDHDRIRGVTRRLLEDLGYQVAEAIDGMHAREALEANPSEFEVLLTDLTMPRLRGDDLAVWVRSRRPEFPIAFLSGLGEEGEARARAVPGPAIPVVHKPFTMSELAEGVRAALAPHRQHRDA
jgi:two-component system cell cycle sensor histidine kinase/response regulator CckA